MTTDPAGPGGRRPAAAPSADGFLRDLADAELGHACDQAAAADRVKSDFLANMSHELRTPLNAVIGFSEIMLKELFGPLGDPRYKEYLRDINDSGQHLLAMINDILSMSNTEAGQIGLQVVTFDMERLVRDVVAPFQLAAQDKGVFMGCVVADGARGLFRADPARIRQLLETLLSNAVKFTARGQIWISAAYADGALTVRVADTGVGIPQDQLPSLFETFVQADMSMTRRFGGAGLGLAICRRLVRLMGGSLKAESTEGEGSTFVISLPMPRTGDVAPPARRSSNGKSADVWTSLPPPAAHARRPWTPAPTPSP